MEEHTPATDHIRAIHVTARQTDRHIQTKEHHSLVGAAEGSASRVSVRFRSRIFWKTMVRCFSVPTAYDFFTGAERRISENRCVAFVTPPPPSRLRMPSGMFEIARNPERTTEIDP